MLRHWSQLVPNMSTDIRTQPNLTVSGTRLNLTVSGAPPSVTAGRLRRLLSPCFSGAREHKTSLVLYCPSALGRVAMSEFSVPEN